MNALEQSMYSLLCIRQEGRTYRRSAPRSGSQTRFSSPRETLAFVHLQPKPASAQLKAQRGQQDELPEHEMISIFCFSSFVSCIILTAI